MTTWTIVVAAGSGSRFGGPKQYEMLDGKRVIDLSLIAARTVSSGVVLVVPPEFVGRSEPLADRVVEGGATRSASTRAGLAALPPEAEVVIVHDAARPLAHPSMFAAVVAAVVAGADAAVPVIDVVDTLRTRAGGAVDRDDFVIVQTPQAFSAPALHRAHAAHAEATDDASLVTACGGIVVHVEGRPENLKITRPLDLVVASALLSGSDRW